MGEKIKFLSTHLVSRIIKIEIYDIFILTFLNKAQKNSNYLIYIYFIYMRVKNGEQFNGNGNSNRPCSNIDKAD